MTSAPTAVVPDGRPSGPVDLMSTVEIARRLWRELTEERRLLLGTIASGLAAQLGLAGAAISTATIVGRAATGHAPTPVLLAVLAAGIAIAGVATWSEMYLSHDLAYRVMAGMRVRLFDRLRRLIPSRQRSRHSGDLVTTALADVESLEWVFAHVFGQILVASSMLIGSGVGLALMDPLLVLVLAVAATLVLSVPWWRRSRADRLADEQRAEAGRLSAEVIDTVHGMSVLIAAGALTTRLRAVAATARAVDRLSVRLSIRAGLDGAVIDTALAAAGLAGLLSVVGSVRSGAVPAQDTPVVLALFGLALAPVAAIGGSLRNLGTTRTAGTRICRILDAAAEVPDSTRTAHPAEDAAALRVRGVRFGYDPNRPVLHDLSLELREGEMVALVGESGAGKSTLVHLIQRFHDVDAGSVEIGGADIRQLPEKELRQRVTTVAQQIDLFAGTLRENLLLGDPQAGAEQLAAAIRVAQLSEVIDRLPGGLEGLIGDRGTTLSGGERARVALARAIVPRPRVLILDEAVAGMDAILERAVHGGLRELHPRPAILVVAHRPSTIAACDRVVRMERGQVITDG
ncbi:MAG: ABC transporter ATP-binding protein [Nakamurella sp.]